MAAYYVNCCQCHERFFSEDVKNDDFCTPECETEYYQEEAEMNKEDAA